MNSNPFLDPLNPNWDTEYRVHDYSSIPPKRPPPPRPKPPVCYTPIATSSTTVAPEVPNPPVRVGSLRKKKVEKAVEAATVTQTDIEEVPPPPKRIGSLRKKKTTVPTGPPTERPPPVPLPRTIFFEPWGISI